ncbi:transcription termination factor 2 [Anopheles marshallii]|uniref:transcription termination factor 2 n=1 Tax=Anopheles marshallii TaxID=1521116 RepID=UPI00237A2465|nr:transcription termination factor 2 [Anopheles marshallii]
MSAENFFVEDSAEEDSLMENQSFGKFRDAESIVIDETDSSATVESSVNSVNNSSAASEEENMVLQMKKRQSKRMSLHPRQVENEPSDESEQEDQDRTNDGSDREEDVSSGEEDEDEVERRAFSPVTRMSIHGVAAVGTSDDEDPSGDERTGGGSDSEDEIITTTRKNRKKIVISDDENGDGTKNQNDSEGAPRYVETGNNVSSTFHQDDDQDAISTKLSSTLKSEAESNAHNDERNESRGELSFNGGRHSISIRASIGEKLSSTHIVEEIKTTTSDAENKPSIHNDSSSVRLIEKSLEILSVSSGEENEVSFQGVSQANVPASGKPAQQNLVQPTITGFVRGQQKQRVSQSEYDAKVRRMADLKSQLVLIESVMKNSAKLPDKGAGLVRRLADIKSQIFELAKDIEMTRATPSKGIKKTIQQNFDQSQRGVESSRDASADGSVGAGKRGDFISWDTIKKTTDDIQPRHTGKQGIATFENQKLLTMDRLATLHKSIETCPTEDTLADPPKLLKIDLMNHQRHALAWMLWRETQKPRGGILADDMGLGKTLSMISLVLKSAELDPDGELLERESESEGEEEENQNPNGGWKSKGRKDYYAGGTLIVCPASLIRQWESEITNRVKRNSLSVCVHHGTQRESKPRQLAKYDIVITTYNIVSRESKVAARGCAGVYGVNWERIILDEAHVIRNHKSNMSESCCGLKGRYRWLLTGTPIQNKEMDVYALMKFLRCTPFNDLVHWKRWIDNKTAGGAMRLNTIMKSIMLRRTKKELQERGALTSLPSKTVEVIEVELEKDEMNVYQKVLMYSKHLFAQFLHQRAEKEHAINYGFGGNRPTFSQRGGANYAFDKVHQKLKRMHDDDGKEVKQHQILVLLLRLRQICCHPGLIYEMLSDDDEGALELSGADEASLDSEVDLLGQLNKLKLNDVIAEHETNLANGGDGKGELSLNLSDKFDRPEAMAKAASKVMLKSNPIFRIDRASSKIERAMQLLEEKIFATGDKAIVVSQWTSMLEILGSHLSARNVPHVSLTGKVPVKLRNDIVVAFNNPSGKSKIILLSLTAGGVGLNLVGANHLFLLDPHWNPQLEAQAQDRIYRVGQTKSVYIWKFMCAETVEQKIHALQQHKLGIADGVLTGTVNKGSKLTMDDLKSLFGL